MEHKLISCTVFCDKCKQEYIIDFTENFLAGSQLRFLSHEAECEMCGSHGETKLEFKCPKCKRIRTIYLDSW